MKNTLQGLLLLVLVVAILVAGYYIGLAIAIGTVVLTSIGLAIAFFVFVCYLVWDIFRYRKTKDRMK